MRGETGRPMAVAFLCLIVLIGSTSTIAVRAAGGPPDPSQFLTKQRSAEEAALAAQLAPLVDYEARGTNDDLVAIDGPGLPVIEWDVTDPDFKSKVVAFDEPLFIKGSFQDWPAVRIWTPEFFMEQFGSEDLPDVWRHTDGVFVHTDSSRDEMFKWNGLPIENPFQIQSMTVDEFFGNVTVDRSDPVASAAADYYYFAAGLETIDPIKHHAEPSDRFKFDAFSSSLWMGGEGVTARLHTDANANFFNQIYGYKRFTLVDPSYERDVYLYPCMHPAFRQSQVNFTAPDLDLFPNFARVPMKQVVVGPGDSIYIPPYYFHHVESLSLAISVSQHSRPFIMEMGSSSIKALFDLGIPFEEEWTEAALRVATQVYVQMILESLYGAGSALPWLDALHHSRYNAIFHGIVYTPERIAAFCPSRAGTTGTNTLGDDSLAISDETIAAYVAHMAERAEVATALMRDVPHAIREMYFGNYVENIANNFVGLDNIDIWLGTCNEVSLLPEGGYVPDGGYVAPPDFTPNQKAPPSVDGTHDEL